MHIAMAWHVVYCRVTRGYLRKELISERGLTSIARSDEELIASPVEGGVCGCGLVRVWGGESVGSQ